MNLFLGTFDGVLAEMQRHVSVGQVVTQRGRLRNLRLKSELQGQGVLWDEVSSRAEFDAVLARAGGAELCVVAGFSYILPQALIDRCRDVVNFHPGIIERCRGPQPVAAAILRSHSNFGVTVHRIDSEAVDAGPILAQRELDIDYAKSYDVNYQRVKVLMSGLAAELFGLYRQEPWPPGRPWRVDEADYFPRASAEEIRALAAAPDLALWRPGAPD